MQVFLSKRSARRNLQSTRSERDEMLLRDPLRPIGSFLEGGCLRLRLQRVAPLSSLSEPGFAQRPPRALQRRLLGSRNRCLARTSLPLGVVWQRLAIQSRQHRFPSQCRVDQEGSDPLSLLTQRRLLPETRALPHGQTCPGDFPGLCPRFHRISAIVCSDEQRLPYDHPRLERPEDHVIFQQPWPGPGEQHRGGREREACPSKEPMLWRLLLQS